MRSEILLLFSIIEWEKERALKFMGFEVKGIWSWDERIYAG